MSGNDKTEIDEYFSSGTELSAGTTTRMGDVQAAQKSSFPRMHVNNNEASGEKTRN
jgi:hypothetical protein